MSERIEIIEKEVFNQLDKLDKELKKILETIKDIVEEGAKIKFDMQGAKNVDEFANATDKAGKNTEKLTEKQKELNKIHRQIEQQEAKLTAEYLKEAKALQEVKEKVKANTAATKEAAKAADKLNTATKYASDSIKAMRERNSALRKEMDLLSTTTKEGREQMAKYRAEIDKNTKAIKDNTDADRERTMGIGDYKDNIIAAAKAMLSPAGIIAAVTMLAVKFYDLAKSVTESRRQVAQLTKLSGEDLNNFTSQVKATAQVFDVDFKEVLIAANALSKQMGISLPDAIAKINKGFADGANSTGQFLDMIKEYSPQFKAAGLSADQAVQIMSQGVKEGIYSDKGADVIKEATLRIREMPKATQDAIKGIGIDSVKMQEQLKAGTITVFDAMQQISKKLATLPPQSAAVGTAIADIFGGPGEDAGLEYIKLLGKIKVGLNELPLTDFGNQQLKNLEATENLNKAVDKWLGNGTTKFDAFMISVKNATAAMVGNETIMQVLGDAIGTVLLGALYPFLGVWDDIKKTITNTTDAIVNFATNGMNAVTKSVKSFLGIAEKQKEVEKELQGEEKKRFEQSTNFYKEKGKQAVLTFEEIAELNKKDTKEYKAKTKEEIEAAKKAAKAKEAAEKEMLAEMGKAYDDYYKDLEKKREKDLISTIDSFVPKKKTLEEDSKAAIETLTKENELKAEILKNRADEEERIRNEENEKLLENIRLTNETLIAIGETRLNNIEVQRQKELKLAGDNKEKQAKINEKYDKEEAKVRRNQAIREKLMTVIELGFILAKQLALQQYFKAALTATQIVAVATKKIPGFAKGVKNFEGGMAFVGEEGRELIQQKTGKMFLTPEKTTLAHLEKGSTVIPHNETEKILAQLPVRQQKVKEFQSQENLLILELLKSNKRLENTIKKKKFVGVNIDSKGLSYYTQQGETRTNLHNIYFRSKM